MARTKKTTKTVMDKNIAYSLEIVKDGIDAEKKGKSFVDSKIDMYQLTDAFEYISRHKDLTFKVMAQRNKNVAEALKVIMFHGVNAPIRLEENLKKQPAKEAEEEYYDASIKLFEEESKLPSEIRKDFRSCFIDPTKGREANRGSPFLYGQVPRSSSRILYHRNYKTKLVDSSVLLGTSR